MVLVLEFVLRVDAALDPDVVGRAGGQRLRFGDADLRCCGEQAAHPIARAVGPEDEDSRGEGDQPGGKGDQR
jgi:hypothetical protein